jgi:LuxR family quorum-sensing transcriptional regulator LasR
MMANNANQSSTLSSALPNFILLMAELKTETQLVESLNDVTKLLQFDYYNNTGDFALDRHKSIRKNFSSLPVAWNKNYADCKYDQVDPILQHAHTHLTPAVWSNVCNTSKQQDFLNDARHHGIGNGVSFPIHARNGDTAMLSFANHVERHDTDEVITRSLPEGSLAATFVHDAMRRIVDKERKVLLAPLTRRELECLYWIAIGKSNWEISKILGVSEHGVVYYVRKLMFKFGVNSRHQAVARATAFGLL